MENKKYTVKEILNAIELYIDVVKELEEEKKERGEKEESIKLEEVSEFITKFSDNLGLIVEKMLRK